MPLLAIEGAIDHIAGIGQRRGELAIANALYLNCDLPSTVDRLADPERFLGGLESPVLILDDIDQLADPSRLLKIAADAFPAVKVLGHGLVDARRHPEVSRCLDRTEADRASPAGAPA